MVYTITSVPGRLWLRTGNCPSTGHILEKRQRLVTREKSRKKKKSPEKGDGFVKNQEVCGVAQGYITYLACTRSYIQVSAQNTEVI